ncbi:EscU/YscU/HrcU family type III secretion system export apparatus switch protein [Pseudoduganella namucuonensis]|uniref:Flagellar biosynthetic protein FlhB n=1 Tax=Pseudoduganella namucuonensis TaxID=1035707 RepID=A0A1I7M3X0_9BURK|nr:EscU/YscU/HrcU family type III secretion system export apparatus switch protein [Pseudoduganella namucuonensis]SFV16615.1 flagellar biosynthetic protein FlhB [Pseudoduganella namucuonensis]
MAEQDSDLSEQATPYKLEEARKKGNVARSNDFTAMAMMAALVLTIYANGWDALRQALRMQQQIMARATQLVWSTDAMAAWMGQLLTGMLVILGPLFLALVVTAVLANVFQTGPIFSFHPLSPDLTRLSPATGFKRVFSMRTLFEAAKSCVKLAILTTVAYFLVRDVIPGLIGLSAVDAKSYARTMIGLCGTLLVKLLLVLLLIALLDLGFTRWEFSKRMRMSKRDVKDEMKNRDGDPRIRARIRELRKEMLKRSKSMGKVPGADVLITNPTHLAVALSYAHGKSGAPQVVAKGAGDLARRMREVAARHQVPIVQNRALARTLFREVDYDGYVPEKLYPQIAKIMVWVYTMREAKRNSGKAV